MLNETFSVIFKHRAFARPTWSLFVSSALKLWLKTFSRGQGQVGNYCDNYQLFRIRLKWSHFHVVGIWGPLIHTDANDYCFLKCQHSRSNSILRFLLFVLCPLGWALFLKIGISSPSFNPEFTCQFLAQSASPFPIARPPKFRPLCTGGQFFEVGTLANRPF